MVDMFHVNALHSGPCDVNIAASVILLTGYFLPPEIFVRSGVLCTWLTKKKLTCIWKCYKKKQIQAVAIIAYFFFFFTSSQSFKKQKKKVTYIFCFRLWKENCTVSSCFFFYVLCFFFPPREHSMYTQDT